MAANRQERAKQFLPFDALKGLKEALKEKEIEYQEKKELSEDSLTILQNEFNKIEKGSRVMIKYYKNKKYINVIGIVTNIDIIKKKIQINNRENINMSDILKIVSMDVNGDVLF